jgi:hypothetical protein
VSGSEDGERKGSMTHKERGIRPCSVPKFFVVWDTVALSFLFGNYCLIMD